MIYYSAEFMAIEKIIIITLCNLGPWSAFVHRYVQWAFYLTCPSWTILAAMHSQIL
jgi:hypothetical protein